MSSMHERGEVHFELGSVRFEVEHVGEMQHGLWFPLSGVLDDLYRPGIQPTSQEVYPIVRSLIESFDGLDVGVRGSTAIYKLLNVSNIERRGTISAALQTKLKPAAETVSDSPSAQALIDLQNASDFDFFLPGVDAESFDTVTARVEDRIMDHAARKSAFQKNKDEVMAGQTKWSITTNNKKEDVVLNLDNGVVSSGIPYSEINVATSGGKKLATVFWTPGEIDSENIQDTRRDPRFSLSWDVASCGALKKDLPAELKEDAEWVDSARRLVGNPGYNRMTNAAGVFAPSPFLKKESDVWFHIPKENVDALCRPIEIGSGFFELPALEQFTLALRAAQKGALAEENIYLSNDRINDNSKTPAISPEASAIFRAIDPEVFREQYSLLSIDDKKEFDKEIMQYMMMGLFYPQKFITYCSELGIFRFFPQLQDIHLQEWESVMGKLPDHRLYTKRQYIGTHYDEVSGLSSVDGFIQQVRKYNSVANPYHQLFRAMWEAIPEKTPDVDNAFSLFDILLDLNAVEFENKPNSLKAKSTCDNEASYIGWEHHWLLGLNDEREEIYKKNLELASKVQKLSRIGMFIGLGSYVLLGDEKLLVGGILTGLLGTLPQFIKLADTIDEDYKDIISSIQMLDEEIDQSDVPKG